jgi:hypothetical protein
MGTAAMMIEDMATPAGPEGWDRIGIHGAVFICVRR